jgi:PilZ domain
VTSVTLVSSGSGKRPNGSMALVMLRNFPDLETESSSSARLEIGMVVRVESAEGDLWSARITNVSDQLVGLRGYMTVDRQFRVRDRVTVHLGKEDSTLCFRADVLAANGTLMRVVRRDASVEQERRRAPRLRVEQPAIISVDTDEPTPQAPRPAELVDLSSSGCALRCNGLFRIGTRLRISLTLANTEIELCGAVVRTWNGGAPGNAPSPHCGVQFDHMPALTTRLLNRFLVEQLREV